MCLRHSASGSLSNSCAISRASSVLWRPDLGDGLGDLFVEAGLAQDTLGDVSTDLGLDPLGRFLFQYIVRRK